MKLSVSAKKACDLRPDDPKYAYTLAYCLYARGPGERGGKQAQGDHGEIPQIP
jgi:hypothetical protein